MSSNILKNAAKVRFEAESNLFENNSLPSNNLIEELKPKLEIEMGKLDRHLEFKDTKNVHHEAYIRETEAILSCLDQLKSVPASNNDSKVDVNQEVKIGNVISTLKYIGIGPKLISKFLAEMRQFKLEEYK